MIKSVEGLILRMSECYSVFIVPKSITKFLRTNKHNGIRVCNKLAVCLNFFFSLVNNSFI